MNNLKSLTELRFKLLDRFKEKCFSIVAVERINSYKLVNIKNIKDNESNPTVLSSQPHLER